MPNIKFSFLYRDGSNYKNYGYVIFENSLDIDLLELERLIKRKLIYDTYFYHQEWQLPNLRFADWCFETDPTWHEFESVEYTDELSNIPQQLSALMYAISKYKGL